MRKIKDSGVAWVGAMPEDWTVKRGKFTLKLLNRPVKDTDDVITCFRDGEVTLRTNRRTDGFTVSVKEIGYQGIEPGDLVIHGMDGFAGSIGISDSRGKSSPVLVVCDTDESKRYIMYYLRSMAYNDVFTALATGIRVRSCDLRWNKLAELPYILPSLPEQNQIVSAIESNTSKVDALIANVQAQIEKLKAYKQSLITEVVTKGLDPNAPMKDSGVEWIGTIPVSWKTIRVKQLLRERKERSVNGKEEPLSMSQKVGLVPTKMLDMIPNMASSFVGAKLAYVDDLVFNKLKAHLGVFSVSKYDGLVSPDYAVYYSTGIIDLKYLEYLFKTPQCISEFRKRSTGIAAGLTRLYTDGLFAIECPMPSKDEQAEIVLFLNEKCAQIDELMSLKQTKIEKLEQYKRSLIYEYVTGKKEVS